MTKIEDLVKLHIGPPRWGCAGLAGAGLAPGYIWVYMSIYENIWVYMSIYEYIWVYMSIYEYIWVYMRIH